MNNVNIQMYESNIQNVRSGKHLGHNISFNGSLVNLEPVIKDMKVRTNVINHQFYSTSWQSEVMLFNSQCMSLYGCQLCNHDDPRVEELSVVWLYIVCCHRLLPRHQRPRSHLLPHIMNSLPFRNVNEKRMLSLFIMGLHYPLQHIQGVPRVEVHTWG